MLTLWGPKNMENLQKYIDDIHYSLMIGIQENNVDLLNDLIPTWYTEDALLFPSNHFWIKGIEAIKAYWADSLTPDWKDLRCETLDLELHDDTAYEIGKATNIFLEEGELITYIVTYLIVWKLQDGVWKIHVDIWNDSIPPSE